MRAGRARWGALALALAATGCASLRSVDACRVYDAAPRVAAEQGGLSARAWSIWGDVERRGLAFWSVPTSFAVVEAPSGLIEPRSCRGVPSVSGGAAVFVPLEFLQRTYAGLESPGAVPLFARREDADGFLAFVLGHELGHRIEQIDERGARAEQGLTGAERLAAEVVADKRGAFFAVSAGYRQAEVVRRDLLAEMFGERAPFAVRHGELGELVRQFSDYEQRYQAAVALAWAGKYRASQWALAWLDARLARGDALPIPRASAGRAEVPAVPLPEVRLARAMVNLMEAAPRHGACRLLAPASTSLVEERRGRTRAWREVVEEALRFVREAVAIGGRTPASDVMEACAEYYLGNLEAAARALASARSKAASPGVEAIIGDDEALLREARERSQGREAAGDAATAAARARPPVIACAGRPSRPASLPLPERCDDCAWQACGPGPIGELVEEPCVPRGLRGRGSWSLPDPQSGDLLRVRVLGGPAAPFDGLQSWACLGRLEQLGATSAGERVAVVELDGEGGGTQAVVVFRGERVTLAVVVTALEPAPEAWAVEPQYLLDRVTTPERPPVLEAAGERSAAP